MNITSDRVVTSFSKSTDVFDTIVVVAHVQDQHCNYIALLDLYLLEFHYSAWLAKGLLQQQSQLIRRISPVF